MDSRVLRQKNMQNDISHDVPEPPNKRRRAAFGNLTNKHPAPVIHDLKKKTIKKVSTVANENKRPTYTRAKAVPKQNSVKAVTVSAPAKVPAGTELTVSSETANLHVVTETIEDAEIIDLCTRFDWIDVDKDNKDSPFHVTDYVNDIFEYYKARETKFAVKDYMSRQAHLNGGMRAILVDWLIEVQQNFELHHETLYLAVALTDLYLAQQTVSKDRLQLLGATALLVASKFEERSPPLVDDFVYICDDTYSREELLEMERLLLKIIDFDLGVPLSYTFLRRYAQCARVSLVTLTLARYILESSLVDYTYVNQRASLMAAASLLLAMRMNADGEWDRTMVHYTGYEAVKDLSVLARQLNTMVRKAGHGSLKTVLTKYSHKVFHEVATISSLDDARLGQLLPLAALSKLST